MHRRLIPPIILRIALWSSLLLLSAVLSSCHVIIGDGCFDLRGPTGFLHDGCPDPDLTPPAPVTTQTASSRTDDSITLTWEPSSSNDVAAIRIIWESEDGTQSGSYNITDPTQTTLTVTNLDPNISYIFRIATIDTSGNTSEQSTSIVSASTAISIAFPRTEYRFVNAETPGSIVGTLPEPTLDIDLDDNTSPPPADITFTYRIVENPDDDSAAFAINADAPNQIIVADTALDAAQTYRFAVAATSSQGAMATTTIRVSPLDTTAPAPVTNVNATPDLLTTKITLTWDDSPSADAAFVRITWVHDTSGTAGGPIRIAQGDKSAIIDGLISDASYTFTLVVEDTAINAQGILTPNLSDATTTTATTTDLIRPDPITMPSATPDANGSEVTLTWVDSISSDATRVLITWKESIGGTTLGPITAAQGDESAIIRGLTSETTYEFSLVVEDDAGISSNPMTISATTPDVTDPDPIPAATVIPDASGTKVTLTWTASPSTDVDHVEITWGRSDGSGTPGGPIPVNAGTTTATIMGLIDETDYTFTLVAVDTVGNRAMHTDITGTTADITAPTAATIMSATPVPATVNVDLAWTPSSDSDVATVSIEWTTSAPGVPNGSRNITPITATTATITGLHPATTYTFTVHTTDTTGNSRPSTGVTVTTDTPPDITPPAALTITTAIAVANSSDVTLTWSTPALDVATITVRWALFATPNTNIGTMPITPITTTTATITGLNAATAYVFSVRASDAAGNTADSITTTVTTNTPPDITAPDPVSMVTDTAATGTTITLSWRASSSADADMVHITWIPNHGGGTTGMRIRHAPGTQSATISGLQADTPYAFTLTAEDAARNRSRAVTHTATTLDTIDPNPISSFSAQALAGGTSVELTWADSSSADAASVHITWTPTHNNGATGMRIAQGTQSATITGLTSDTPYIFSAVVEDEVPNRSMLRTATIRTLDITRPDPISNLVAMTTAGSTVVTLSWDNSPSDDATSIRITWMVTGSATVDGMTTIPHGPATTTTITGLTSEESYEITLVVLDDALNTAGTSDPNLSSAVDTPVTIPDAVSPSAVSNFTATPLPSATEIALSWRNSGSADAATLEIAWTSTAPGITPGSTTIASGTGTSTHTISGLTSNTPYRITITVIDDANNRSATRTASPNPVTTLSLVDADGDTLIDISSLDQLHNMRHNLAGTSYKSSSSATGIMCGTAGTIACTGYELTQNLDFATAASYDSNIVNAAWRPNTLDPDDATNVGWEPVNNFAAIFEGNGNTISNLYARRAGRVGLFGQTNNNVTIRAIGIIDNALYGSTGADYVGGLVGENNGGTIIASYATGDADGGDGTDDRVGGLVGFNGGTITATYATGDADGGDGNNDRVGGLVGHNDGTITASYATGDVDGGDGNIDYVGGLVGLNANSITASYATGDADGGDGDNDQVGGLAGYSDGGSITASYAIGNADGGDGTNDQVGGLVGDNDGRITASYGFGTLTNVGTAGVHDSGSRPNSVLGFGSGRNGARLLTATNTPAAWNSASSNSLSAWDFGAITDIPTLRYADYDGAGTTYGCGSSSIASNVIPATVPNGSGGTTTVACGTTSLPGQTPAVDPSLLVSPIDADADGLIDISSLDQLNNMRHNLAGTSYKTSGADSGISCGTALNTACTGYELTQNLDFTDGTSYGNGVVNNSWRPNAMADSSGTVLAQSNAGSATNAGWEPIGSCNGDSGNSEQTNPCYGNNTPFAAVFEGNSLVIRNLYARNTDTSSGNGIGLFRVIGSSSTIRNLGVANGALYGSGSDDDTIGGLVGHNEGIISNSYATGDADGGDGDHDHVGGLVGWNRGTITASYATGDADGGDDDVDFVGGLVGSNDGTITASYATGDADGGTGDRDFVGALVGFNNRGTITASYATGDADGGEGDDNVGGLVGENRSTITSSYASGTADGGTGSDNVGGLVGGHGSGFTTGSYATGTADGGQGVDSDNVGGLVGYNDGGTITASYATGDADGGDGTSDRVGGLMGYNDSGTITASYGFGTLINVNIAGADDSGSRPSGVLDVGSGRNGARFLTAINTPAAWNSASSNTQDAWGFGSTTDIPTLRYADYDGAGTTYGCGSSSTASNVIPATVPNGSGGTTTVACGTTSLPGQTPAVDPSLLVSPIDADGDTLIDISSLDQLHNMRHNLAGTSYKTSSGATGISCGVNFSTACTGYELTQNLDFDRDGGGTYDQNIYTLDAGDHHATYFPVSGGTGGWLPIGDAANPFSTIFEGNGFFIRGLAVRRNETYVGMFGYTDSNAIIRNIRLTNNLADYTGSSNNNIYVGGLVAYNNGGTISASHAGGTADGGNGDDDNVGGLVGWNTGTITASYASGTADGGNGDSDRVGGLVGSNTSTITASYASGTADGGNGDNDRIGGLAGHNEGTITASYASGTADGGDGNTDRVGGLAGHNEGTIITSYATSTVNGSNDRNGRVGGLVGNNSGTIIASYATGNANGGDGANGRVGGLVGEHFSGTITASYATGDVNGGDDDQDRVGGLVGVSRGTITASYATGDVDGGDGSNDYVGGLVAENIASGTITASYGFGTLTNVDIAGVDHSGTRPSGVLGVGSGRNGARLLTADNTPAAWNSASSKTQNAWDFGTTTDIPTLRYADYDGAGNTYRCTTIPTTVPNGNGGTTSVICGSTSIPGQTPAVTPPLNPFDTDGDRLIDISSLNQLHNMRYNLAGTSYKTSSADSGVSCGISLNTACRGYELTRSLTFDRDSDVTTYDQTIYTLDAGDHHATYFPVSGGTGGWLPIGDATNPFNTTFEGNGFFIRGLAVRRNQTYVGMFGRTNSNAIIRNIRLTNNLADYTGSSNNNIYVGGLVAYNRGVISASHAGGDADGGSGNSDNVGGLVGVNNSIITASYATGDVDGGDGNFEYVGGLVGINWIGGTITASYATGDVDGGSGTDDAVGGLVGSNAGSTSISSTITASYATGDADGGDDDRDDVGGLVGSSISSIIIASYATGDADGGDGNNESVGSLVGHNDSGTITASYATGDADGGTGTDDHVGTLAGFSVSSTITASYGFGSTMNVDTAGVDDSGDRHHNSRFAVGRGIDGARAFASIDRNSFRSPPAVWDQASSNTQDVWSFAIIDDTQAPALRYADYDDTGTTYGCGSSSNATIVIPDRVPVSDGIPGGFIDVTCGTTLLGGPQPR